MSRSRKARPAAPKARPRNRLAYHPLLAKGGIHQKTRKAERRAAKQALRRDDADLRRPRAA